MTIIQPSGQRMISAVEVAKHDHAGDCWVIIGVSLFVCLFCVLFGGGVLGRGVWRWIKMDQKGVL
jgi:hypothetical protein